MTPALSTVTTPINCAGGQLAETYGYLDHIHIDALKRDLSRAHWKSNFYTFASWALGLTVFVAGLVYAYRRKWFFLSRAAYDAHRTQKDRR